MTKEKINIPATVEKEIFISIGVGRLNFNEIRVLDFIGDGSDMLERVLLKSQIISIDLSDPQISSSKIRPELVEQLQARLKKVKAEASMEEGKIQERIDNLMAIGCKPEPEVEIDTADKRHPRANTIGG